MQYAKVAEYQLRGVVHFHALVRLDGPQAPPTVRPRTDRDRRGAAGRPGPTSRRLGAAHRPRRRRPTSDPARVLAFGRQLDARPVRTSRRTDDPDRALIPGAGRRLPGQVRHQVRHRHRATDNAAPAADPRPPPATSPPVPTAAPPAGRRGRRLRAARQVGAHARLPRPLRHQVPPLLDHPRRPAPRPPPRPGPDRPVTAPRAGHSTWPRSRPTCSPTTTTRPPSSSATGTTSAPAGPTKAERVLAIAAAARAREYDQWRAERRQTQRTTGERTT